MEIIKVEVAREATHKALENKIADAVIEEINSAISDACSHGNDSCTIGGLACFGYEHPSQVEYLATFVRSAGYFAKVDYDYKTYPTLTIRWTNK